MSTFAETIEPSEQNTWRLETPGAEKWARTARPDDHTKKKYFMVSCDTHLNPPPKLFQERIDKKFLDLLPRIEVRDGVRWMVQEGNKPQRLYDAEMFGDDLARSKAGMSHNPDEAYTPLDLRLLDQDRDGVDAEVIFPNGPALMMYGGDNVEFIAAQCRVWNDFAIEFCRPALHRSSPVAAIPTLDVDVAVAEIQRAAKLGFKILNMPYRPYWGPEDPKRHNYNHPKYDPMWAAVQDSGLPTTFHAGSGKDPRGASGNGGAVANYVLHGCLGVMEPLVLICCSGVIERFPKMKFAAIEGNAGWIPWMLDMMDEAFRKHHFWVRPKMKELPSTYFRTNGGASLAEDRSALLTVEHYGLEDNLFWANDFPHHEGSWPFSGQAIERIFGHLKEETRAKVLGLSAAKFFGFEVPEEFR